MKEQAANAKDKAQASFADAGRSERSTPTTTGYDQRGTGSADSTQ
ncbi:MAG: hypothetical protein ABIU87_01670 [Ornithinibacter sp.]